MLFRSKSRKYFLDFFGSSSYCAKIFSRLCAPLHLIFLFLLFIPDFLPLYAMHSFNIFLIPISFPYMLCIHLIFSFIPVFQHQRLKALSLRHYYRKFTLFFISFFFFSFPFSLVFHFCVCLQLNSITCGHPPPLFWNLVSGR